MPGNFRASPGSSRATVKRHEGIVMFTRRLIGTIAALVVIAVWVSASAGGASGPLDNRPVRFWSFSEVKQGVGNVKVAAARSWAGCCTRSASSSGRRAFNFPESKPRGVATGEHLLDRERQDATACWPRRRRPTRSSRGRRTAAARTSTSSRPTRSGPTTPRCASPSPRRWSTPSTPTTRLLPSECPSGLDCNPIRGIVRFHARAYAESAGGDFFRSAASRTSRATRGAGRSRRPRRPTRGARCGTTGTSPSTTTSTISEPSRTRSRSCAHRVTMNVPLSSLRDGELFAVHVSLDAETIDARGRESAVEAFIQDPQKRRRPRS